MFTLTNEDSLRMMKWTGLLMMLWLIQTGCVTTKLANSTALIERHPVGFRHAVNASPEATEFVRDALKTINRLEATIEAH
ncbi:MAG: hypothetical protein VW907_03170 [Opitutae bacterium]